MNYETVFCIAIFSGAFCSTLMDSAFPYIFDQYRKPFGCSKCMAFWVTLITITSISYLCNSIQILQILGGASLAHFIAAFASRTFRGQ